MALIAESSVLAARSHNVRGRLKVPLGNTSSTQNAPKLNNAWWRSDRTGNCNPPAPLDRRERGKRQCRERFISPDLDSVPDFLAPSRSGTLERPQTQPWGRFLLPHPDEIRAPEISRLSCDLFHMPRCSALLFCGDRNRSVDNAPHTVVPQNLGAVPCSRNVSWCCGSRAPTDL